MLRGQAPIIELIRMMAWGDILMSTAIFGELKSQGYRIRYITSEPFAAALYNNPLLDELITIPFHRGGNPWRRYKLYNIIQKATNNIEPSSKRVWLSNSPNYALLRALLNQFSFGAGDFQFPKINHNIQHIFDEVGSNSDKKNDYDFKLHLYLTPEEEAWGEQFKDVILVQTASSNINKDYPTEYWKELIPQLEQQHQLPVYQVCKADQAIQGIKHLPNVTMRQAMAAVRYCKLLISLDSAFNHVAKAFHKPSIILFGRTHPERFGYSENINLWCGEQWQAKFKVDLKQLKAKTEELPHSLLEQGYHPYMLLNTPRVVLSSSSIILPTSNVTSSGSNIIMTL